MTSVCDVSDFDKRSKHDYTPTLASMPHCLGRLLPTHAELTQLAQLQQQTPNRSFFLTPPLLERPRPPSPSLRATHPYFRLLSFSQCTFATPATAAFIAAAS